MNWYQLIKINRIIKSHRPKLIALMALKIIRLRHLSIKFDPIASCNLRCKMCYQSNPKWRKQHTGKFSWDEINTIAESFFPFALQLSIGCTYEPTTYKRYMDIIRLANNYKIPMISFVTNGQLLKKKYLEEIIDSGLTELILSMHGTRKVTYENLMPPASYDKFLTVLETFNNIKNKYKSSAPQLRINYTVNPDNLNELKNFFDIYGHIKLDTLQIRPIIDLGNIQYKKKDLSKYLSLYSDIMHNLAAQCKERNITLLAFLHDPAFKIKNTAAIIAEEAGIVIDPLCVWKEDYNWKNESYYDYCMRTNWKKNILKKIFTNADKLSRKEATLGYEIL